ncbi:MAG TPA: hypothetical protein ENK53_04580 [Thiotrichales bacterium]|nr:hypothetical protein [Thiotrichales bacterium]
MTRIRLHCEQPGNSESGRILARTGMKALARRLGFSPARIQVMETVLAEMLSNQAKYAAGTGQIQVWEQRDIGGKALIDLFALDFGPGIPDLARAREDGRSSSGTLGKGLGAIERLADACAIYSLAAGQGRWQGVAVWARFAQDGVELGLPAAYGLYLRALNDDRYCGDGLWLHQAGDALFWLHMDGLGHGREAAEAVHGRERLLDRFRGRDCATLLQELDEGLRRSRGAVAILGRMTPLEGTVELCGVGDMLAWRVRPESRQALHFSSGVLGREHRRIETQSFGLGPEEWYLSCSDGIRGRWQPGDYPGLWHQHPQLIAYLLGALEGRSNDDRSLLVIGRSDGNRD